MPTSCSAFLCVRHWRRSTEWSSKYWRGVPNWNQSQWKAFIFFLYLNVLLYRQNQKVCIDQSNCSIQMSYAQNLQYVQYASFENPIVRITVTKKGERLNKVKPHQHRSTQGTRNVSTTWQRKANLKPLCTSPLHIRMYILGTIIPTGIKYIYR